MLSCEGLVFINFGYENAVKVVHELGLSIPTVGTLSSPKVTRFIGSFEARQKALAFIGRKTFNDEKVLAEALIHPSIQVDGLSSYEKLEWTGDAGEYFYVQ